MIKVVDLFAGPGGLSEGFSAIVADHGRPAFDVALSIEKDSQAFETLRLRAFFRQFRGSAPPSYYRALRGELPIPALYEAHPTEAKAAADQCWHATLGPDGAPAQEVRRRIKEAVGEGTGWVLIGGPPCQAYSIAGRSRNSGNPDYDPRKDLRQHLYVEYLQILAEHRPAAFIMENVKGLLSATLEHEYIFDRIIEDLRKPAAAIAREKRNGNHVRGGGYRIYSLAQRSLLEAIHLVIGSQRRGRFESLLSGCIA